MFDLSLTAAEDAKKRVEFFVIGTDGGFLNAPVPAKELLLAPGERADLLIDLRGHLNESLILRNDAPIPYSPGATPMKKDDPCRELLQIQVTGAKDPGDARFDPATIPLPMRNDPLSGVPPNPPARSTFPSVDAAVTAVPIAPGTLQMTADLNVNGVAIKLRRFKLEEHQLVMSTLPSKLVPTVLVNDHSWTTAPPAVVKKNSIEVWEFLNTTPDTHPMHIHLVQFQVMSRVGLNVIDDPSRFAPDLPEPKTITGYTTPGLVHTFEKGWKDTVRCNPNEATRVLIKFDGYAGNYVYHCHILEHEDMGMMYRITVEP